MNLEKKVIIIISKVFYLCGGMGLFWKERFNEGNEWRVDIKDRIEQISNGKVKCCNPNDYFNFLDRSTYESDKEVMEFDLYKVRNSDLVIVNFNDPKSIGSACEMAMAYELKIPIIGLCENGEEKILHPWLKEFCNRVFTDREELILYVTKHYVKED